MTEIVPGDEQVDRWRCRTMLGKTRNIISERTIRSGGRLFWDPKGPGLTRCEKPWELTKKNFFFLWVRLCVCRSVSTWGKGGFGLSFCRQDFGKEAPKNEQEGNWWDLNCINQVKSKLRDFKKQKILSLQN